MNGIVCVWVIEWKNADGEGVPAERSGQQRNRLAAYWSRADDRRALRDGDVTDEGPRRIRPYDRMSA